MKCASSINLEINIVKMTVLKGTFYWFGYRLMEPERPGSPKPSCGSPKKSRSIKRKTCFCRYNRNALENL